MKESKSRWLRDRLSELPESLIFDIFWMLPIRDVVRTTILSKHWKNLWTTAPRLNFEYDDIRDDADIVRNFINGALTMWEGTKIQKFKIGFRSVCEESFCRDIDFWVNFALTKKVQELDVFNPCCSEIETYSVPQDVYSCSSLEVLSLECCVKINGKVQWNQLKSLTIDAHMTEHVINQILCGSPQLEVFILNLVHNYENLSIRSSSLKRLSIENNIIDFSTDLDRDLRIRTPNLETLEILGAPYYECLLMDVSSLTHVTLGFNSPRHFVEEKDLIEDSLLQIFPTIEHVEHVTLSECSTKVLAGMIEEGILPSSSNAKFLKLNNSWGEYEQIVEVLDIFPKLKMLLLKGDMKVIFQLVGEPLEFDANLPMSFLRHLKTIEITWGEGDYSMFPFIKIVLKYASKLEKMVIRVAPPAPPSNSLFLASQKLLTMRRSSPHCKVYFL